MISMEAFTEGLDLTVLGVTIVFIVLSILGVVLYGVGWVERRLVEKEKGAEEETEPAEDAAEPEERIPPRDLAIITAAILAYNAEKAAQLKPVPFRRGVSDAWRLYGIHSTIVEVENFNYGVGKW